MRKIGCIFLGLLCLLASRTACANSALATGPHIQLGLIAEDKFWVAGQTHYVALHMQPESDWHTYWRNPGDSGEAPAIQWTSSADIQVGDILWPLPAPIPVAHLVNYGYSAAHLLMVPIQVPDDATTGESISLSAQVSWLVCKEDCIPGWATLALEMPVAKHAEPSQFASLFTDTRRQLPQSSSLAGSFELSDEHIALAVDGLAPKSWHVFPFRGDVASHSAAQSVVYADGNHTFMLRKSDYFSGSPERLEFLVSDGEQGFYVNAQPVGGTQDYTTQGSEILSITSLLTYAAMAFVGGLLLNIMPCVLPVLSIKALSLNAQAQSGLHKLAYLAGVLVCFNSFAITIIGLQFTGAQLGWGFHLQSPLVIASLAFLFTFIGLTLLDVCQFGGTLANMGNSLVTGNGATSHFFTGVLAVVVASPCTAPFMAAALGVALTQPAAVALLIFNALALGFALPMTLLFASSRVRRWLPKPGPWMNTFKHGLAFPMFATVAWLAWVYAGQTDTFAQFVLLCALIGFAFFLWSASQAKSYGRQLNLLAVIAVIAVVLSQSFGPVPSPSQPNSDATEFSMSDLARLRATNNVVFVNMTADWCITCKVNEHVALKSQAVTRLLQSPEVHYMVGDWTNKNQAILNYLTEFDRAGVPLYVVYAGDHYIKVLPQVLTPDTVVEHLNLALQERANED